MHDQRSEPSSDSAVVSARGMVVRFGDVTALDGVDLDVRRGSIYGLLGPNGAGKTTLIRVLATLLKPDEGSAHVAGVDVLANPALARTRIGLAGQFAAVDEYQTGRENVEMIGRLYRLGKAEARRRTDEILEGIGLTMAANRQVGTYSGGMRRRLDLAASLIGRPEVMFLDEPTTGIDPRSRVGVWDLVRDLVDGGTTVLLTTQYLEEADQLADRIGVIDHGHIITEGTADSLKATLGASIIEIEAPGDELGAYQSVLERVVEGDVTTDVERGTLRVQADAGARTLLAVARAFDDADLVPIDITTKKPTLDDVFLAVTDDSGDHDPGDPDRSDSTTSKARR